MEAIFFSETLVHTYQITWCHNHDMSDFRVYVKLEAVCCFETLIAPTRLHDVKIQKTATWILTAVIPRFAVPNGPRRSVGFLSGFDSWSTHGLFCSISDCRIAAVGVKRPGREASTHLCAVLTSGMSGALPTLLYASVLFVYKRSSLIFDFNGFKRHENISWAINLTVQVTAP